MIYIMQCKRFLTKDDILEIDIETSNICNLKCPMCLSQQQCFDKYFQPKFIDFNKAIDTINTYKNIDNISICGDASEPTLHPQLFEFLDYYKSKPEIHIELFTNGSTHDEKYWNELNTHLSENSFVCFTIAGTLPNINNKYRVGSDLNKIILNAKAFKKDNPYKNDYMQYIRFEYNKHESEKDILNLISQFSNYKIINTDPIYERFNFGNKDQGICADKLFQIQYKQKLSQLKKNGIKQRVCHNYNKRLLKMDNECNVYPCILYRLYKHDYKFVDNNNLDYSDIFNNVNDFCYECDKEMLEFLEKNNRDQLFMC